MKKIIRMAIAFMILLLAHTLPAHAGSDHNQLFGHRQGHLDFGVFLGPGWWGPGFWAPSPYYPYYPYYPQPPLEVQESPANVQATPQSAQPWYFCPELQGYYPYVKECPRSWIKVAPPAHTTDQHGIYSRTKPSGMMYRVRKRHSGERPIIEGCGRSRRWKQAGSTRQRALRIKSEWQSWKSSEIIADASHKAGRDTRFVGGSCCFVIHYLRVEIIYRKRR